MSDIAEQIAREHRPVRREHSGYQADDFYYRWYCRCGAAVYGAVHTFMRRHVAEVTERAVRAHPAADTHDIARKVCPCGGGQDHSPGLDQGCAWALDLVRSAADHFHITEKGGTDE